MGTTSKLTVGSNNNDDGGSCVSSWELPFFVISCEFVVSSNKNKLKLSGRTTLNMIFSVKW